MKSGFQIWGIGCYVATWLQSHPIVVTLAGLVSALFEPRAWRKVLASLLVGGGVVLLFLPFESGNVSNWTVKALFLAAVFVFAFWSVLERIRKMYSRFISRNSPRGGTKRPRSDLGLQFLQLVAHAIGQSPQSSIHAEFQTRSERVTISMVPPSLPPSGTHEVVNRVGPAADASAHGEESGEKTNNAKHPNTAPGSSGDPDASH